MNILLKHLSLRWFALFTWVLFVLMLTTQSDHVPLVYWTSRTIGSTALGAAVGHTGLFGVLTLVLYAVMNTRLRFISALPLTMFCVLVLAAATEFAQIGVANRTPDLTDFLANSLGVFMIGFVISYFTALRWGRQRTGVC